MVLPANNKFAPKPGAPAAKPKATPAPKKKAKAFGPATDSEPRDPMLRACSSVYRVRVLGCEELVHPVKFSKSYRFKIENLTDSEAEGGSTIGIHAVLFMQTTAGVAEYQRLVFNASGYATAAEYNEFDPEGDFFETVIGEANDFAAAGLTIEGRLVDVRVSKGKAVIDRDTNEPKIDPETGEPDYYRNYKWSVVADDEQDAVGKLELPAVE